MLRRICVNCCVLLLAILTTACDRTDLIRWVNPNFDLPLQAALIRQAELSQVELFDRLRLRSQPEIKVDHIKVTERSPITIQDLPSLEVHGIYNLTLKFADHSLTRPQQTFAIFLQPQVEGETWRLARWDDHSSPPQWRTYLLTPPDYYATELPDGTAAQN